MKTFFALICSASMIIAAEPPRDKTMKTALEHKVTTIEGKELDLSTFKGSVVLFVNVASQCGYTNQYAGLQNLYTKYKKDGLVIVAVPSNDFGQQEPGSNAEIQKFCSTNYKVSFPILSKQSILGKEISPLYKTLTAKETNPKHSGEVGWNFEKFLINRKGEIVGRFKSGTEPEDADFIKAIQAELDAK